MIVSPPGSLTCHQHSCRSGRALQLEPRPAPLHRGLKIGESTTWWFGPGLL